MFKQIINSKGGKAFTSVLLDIVINQVVIPFVQDKIKELKEKNAPEVSEVKFQVLKKEVSE